MLTSSLAQQLAKFSNVTVNRAVVPPLHHRHLLHGFRSSLSLQLSRALLTPIHTVVPRRAGNRFTIIRSGMCVI